MTESKKLTEYRKLITDRDELRREADSIYIAYMKKFGRAMTDLFNLKVECIRLKKTAGEIQRAVNRGETPDMNVIYSAVDAEMKTYYDNLNAMQDDLSRAEKSKAVGSLAASQVKSFYRNMVKMIHPDLHPEYIENEEASDLWAEVQKAYSEFNLKRMKELFVLVTDFAKDEKTPEIPDIDERIDDVKAETEKIRTTNPYLYKLILDDAEKCQETLERLADETEDYKNYRQQLNEILKSYNVKGGAVS